MYPFILQTRHSKGDLHAMLRRSLSCLGTVLYCHDPKLRCGLFVQEYDLSSLRNSDSVLRRKNVMTDVDWHTRCSLLVLEREEHLKSPAKCRVKGGPGV